MMNVKKEISMTMLMVMIGTAATMMKKRDDDDESGEDKNDSCDSR